MSRMIHYIECNNQVHDQIFLQSETLVLVLKSTKSIASAYVRLFEVNRGEISSSPGTLVSGGVTSPNSVFEDDENNAPVANAKDKSVTIIFIRLNI